MATSGRASFALAQYGYILGKKGLREEALAVVDELTSRYLVHQSQPTFVAQVWLGLGDPAQAINWARKGLAEMDPNMTEVRNGSILAELQTTNEFQSIIRQLQL